MMEGRLLIGDKIRALRENLGITQVKMAKDLKCSAKMISNYELDKRQPDLFTLREVSEYLNVSCDYLLGRTDCSRDYFLPSLNNDEKLLLEKFKKLPKNFKADVIRYAELNLLDYKATNK